MMNLRKLLYIKKENSKRKEVLEEKLLNKSKPRLEQRKEKELQQMMIFQDHYQERILQRN